MNGVAKFLVVDDVGENRFLLAKTLLRKFPLALVTECSDSTPAIAAAADPQLHAIIVHRTTDCDGLTVVRLLRETNPRVPIVLVSGRDLSEEAFTAGATEFLNYDAWLRVGTLVEDILVRQSGVVDTPPGSVSKTGAQIKGTAENRVVVGPITSSPPAPAAQ